MRTAPLAAAVAAAVVGSSFSLSGLAQEEKRKGYNLQLEEVVVTAQKRE